VAEETTCRWCNQGTLFGPVHLYTVTGAASGDVSVATTPTTGVVRQVTTVPLAVWVCRACGHLDLFATEPETLFGHWSAGER
jgi:hypothetical protein